MIDVEFNKKEDFASIRLRNHFFQSRDAWRSRSRVLNVNVINIGEIHLSFYREIFLGYRWPNFES